MKTIAIAVLVAGLLSVVSTTSSFAEAGTVAGLQVSLGDCLVATPRPKASTDLEKSALDAIAGAVISQGVNYIGKALTAAGSAKTWTVTGSRNMQVASTAFPECVTVVRGVFVTAGGPVSAWVRPSQWPDNLQAKLQDRGIWLTGAPDFIFEGQIVAAKDQSALTIRPIIVTYTNPIGTRFLRSDTKRHSALFLAITPPGTKPTLETSPAATIILGSLSAGTTAKFDPNPDYSSPYESPWFTLTKADAVRPMTVTAMLSETQDEQAFLTFLGSVLSDPKVVAAANTQISQLVIPAVAAQAASDATSKAASLASDADTKLGIVFSKLNACKSADPAGAVSAGADARTALRNYWLADSALAAPRNDVQQAVIDAIDLRQKGSIIKSQCDSVLTSLTKP